MNFPSNRTSILSWRDIRPGDGSAFAKRVLENTHLQQFRVWKQRQTYGNARKRALIVAAGGIAGAGLEVFATEPLPSGNPLWGMEQPIVSLHISGDVAESPEQMVEVFLYNFEHYRNGGTLRNVVDETMGKVGG